MTGRRSQPIRRLAVILATLTTFGVCLWLFPYATFSWLPHATADRWVVAATFAGVGAGAVGTALDVWAKPEDGADRTSRKESRISVKQRARASGKSRITQVGRDLRNAKE